MGSAAKNRAGGIGTWRLCVGIALIVLGLLPFLFPTTYLTSSPLAAPAVELQNQRVENTLCEVCGAQATKRVAFRYTARLDASMEYIGDHNPKKWPGNCKVLYCGEHSDYGKMRKPSRVIDYSKGESNSLGLGTFLYLLLHGSNAYLRVIAVVHLALVAAGVYLMVRRATRNKPEQSAEARE